MSGCVTYDMVFTLMTGANRVFIVSATKQFDTSKQKKKQQKLLQAYLQVSYYIVSIILFFTIHKCCYSINCVSGLEWKHWIGLRLLTECDCTPDCTVCRDAWQWVDGSSTSDYVNWFDSHPLESTACAMMVAADFWLSSSCGSSAQVFCKTGNDLVA